MTSGAAPRKILIVEDDPGVLSVLKIWLAAEGFIVRCAASAEAGIRIAEAERMDLILTDLCLPGMGGFAAIEPLKGPAGVPVLVITGYADEELRKDARCFGALDLVEKPFEHETLLRLVRGVTG